MATVDDEATLNEDSMSLCDDASVSTIYSFCEDEELFLAKVFDQSDDAKGYAIAQTLNFMKIHTPFYVYFKTNKNEIFTPVAIFEGLHKSFDPRKKNVLCEVINVREDLKEPGKTKYSLKYIAEKVYEHIYGKKTELNGWRKLYYKLKTPIDGKEYMPLQKLLSPNVRKGDSIITHDTPIVLMEGKDGKYHVPSIQEKYLPLKISNKDIYNH